MVNFLFRHYYLGGANYFIPDCFGFNQDFNYYPMDNSYYENYTKKNNSVITGGGSNDIMNITNFIVKKSNKVNIRDEHTLNKVAEDGQELPIAKIDGRSKEPEILKMAKTSGKTECLNGSKTCSPPDILSVVGYFVDKHSKKEYKKPRTNEQKLEEAKKILDCPTEACVLTNDKFLNTVVRDHVISIGEIKETLDLFFKPVGDISNHPEEGSRSESMAINIHFWAKQHPEFCFITIPPENKFNKFGRIGLKELVQHPTLSSHNLVKNIELHPQYTKYGTIFNNVLDDLNGSGHATVLFIDISSKTDPWTIEFYNSHGSIPENHITTWMERTRNVLENYRFNKYGNNQVKSIIATTINSQNNSIECGLHAMFYLKCRIEGVPYGFFRKNIIPAEAMIHFRKHVYRNKEYDIN